MLYDKKIIVTTVVFIFLLIIFINYSYAAPRLALVYVVQRGDTLSDIAREYNISVDSLKSKNNIISSQDLRPGQEIIISDQKDTESKKVNFNTGLYTRKDEDDDYSLDVNSTYAVRVNAERSLPEVNIPDSEIIEYKVKRGDTLYDLAREFNTTSGIIMALNNMENNILRVGQLIKVPTHNLTPKQVLARTISREEKNLLAKVIHAEARGEPFQGQVAVGAVILNRIINPKFPDTVQEVVYQSGQFTAVYDGQINLKPNQRAYEAAEKALNGLDPTMGSIYYYNPEIAENTMWFTNKTVNVIIGEHVFAE